MHYVLYIIAFLEWFTTLSVEIMSIRNSIAIIGSNAIATSIILGIILLALSYGYYQWWIYAAKNTAIAIKKKIYNNLIIASVFYTFISFPFENVFLEKLLTFDIGYFLPIFVVVTVLFFLPVFLASQTIPLISELINDEKKAVVIGKLLFFSTIGSFIGSVVTSLVFFSTIGVERSIVVNGIILAVLAGIMLFQFDKKHISPQKIWFHLTYLAVLISLFFLDYSKFLNQNIIYAASTEYNDIKVFDNGSTRLFMMNGSHSSGLDVATGKSYFTYIQEVTRIIEAEKPKKILVIWAAGFSLPQDVAKMDFVSEVDVCDIDGSLDTIAETYFLGEKLHPKITFHKESARYFINKMKEKGETYDFILLDAYSGKLSVPSELLTQEFFQGVREISSGTIAMNLILDSAGQSNFYRKLSNTLNASFDNIYLSKVNRQNNNYFDNFVVLNRWIEGYTHVQTTEWLWIYTDNLNTLEKDKYTLFYSQKTN
jgi:spermidine synthase